VAELGTTEQGRGCGHLQRTRVDEVAEKTKLNGQPWIVYFTVHAGLRTPIRLGKLLVETNCGAGAQACSPWLAIGY